jgi:hypothetical protein
MNAGSAESRTEHPYHDTPSPFPEFSEQSLPAPTNATSKLVYLSYPRNKSVVLFTQGLDDFDVLFCIQDGKKSKVRETKHFGMHENSSCCIIVVECEWHPSWQGGRIVSVGRDESHIIPSTAYLHTELMVEQQSAKYRICAMTQVRDASKFVPDWVRYHRRIGVDHFYIFDNNSSEPYPHDDDVEYIRFPWRKSQYQALMYGVQVAIDAVCVICSIYCVRASSVM